MVGRPRNDNKGDGSSSGRLHDGYSDVLSSSDNPKDRLKRHPREMPQLAKQASATALMPLPDYSDEDDDQMPDDDDDGDSPSTASQHHQHRRRPTPATDGQHQHPQHEQQRRRHHGSLSQHFPPIQYGRFEKGHHRQCHDGQTGSVLASWASRTRKCCSMRTLKKRLPVITWIPKTTLETVVCDLIAGLSVGLTVIPHAFAFAGLAGLPVQYGLYSAFVGCFVYFIFGSIAEVTIGPTATQAMITANFVTNRGLPPQIAVTLCFMSGCFTFIAGLLNLGLFMKFVSVPITSAFTTAVAINIAFSQIKAILGFKFQASGFIMCVRKICENLYKTQLWNTVLGVSCIIFLSTFRFLKPISEPNPADSATRRRLRRALWFACNGSNAVSVILSATLAYLFYSNGIQPFPITGDMPAGIPSVSIPTFSYVDSEGKTHDFLDVLGTIGAGVFVVPILAVLENMSIAKAFAKGKAMDATQEMLAIGISNILGSFVSSMPVTGTFSRTAINASSGVKSPSGGLLTGSIVLFSLAFLTPCFKYIPVATLGAVVICAVIFVVDIPTIIAIWKCKKSDLLPYTATFCGCLFLEMHWGIIFGLIAQVILLLMEYTNPRIRFQKVMVEKGLYSMLVQPENRLLYTGMEDFRAAILKKAKMVEYENTRHVVVDCHSLTKADFSLKRGFEALSRDLKSMDKHLHFIRLRPEVEKVLFHDLDVNVVLQELDDVRSIDKDLRSSEVMKEADTYVVTKV